MNKKGLYEQLIIALRWVVITAILVGAAYFLYISLKGKA